MNRFFPPPPEPDKPIQFPYVSTVRVRRAEVNHVIQSLVKDKNFYFQGYGEEHIAGKKLKPLTKLFRPSFSPKLNSKMIDLVFYSRKRITIQIYLFIMNVNTRFLAVYPIPHKSTAEIYKALDAFINKFSDGKPIYFKGDGEKGFAALEKLMKQMRYPNVHFYLRPTNSQGGYRLTNSYNVIDSVIKTVRNLIGKISQYNPAAFGDTALISKVVQIYNNTEHSALKNKYTPAEVQDDSRLECEYIRECEDEVRRVDQVRAQRGFSRYEPGTLLLVHVLM
jgi:hypothetical protein